MGLTLSHISALDAMRMVRAQGVDLRQGVDYVERPFLLPWKGERWNIRDLKMPEWRWPQPSRLNELHVLSVRPHERVRMTHVVSHRCFGELPPHSFIWLDEHASMVCPELLFLQMAETFSLPALVMLGHELCGTFSRCAESPIDGDVALGVPRATTLEELSAYLASSNRVRGLQKARIAMSYVHDYAVSAPEALLATVYSLPSEESGYAMGPLTLNERINIPHDLSYGAEARYPDIMFSFAPVGINYDGEEHLDLGGLVDLALQSGLSSGIDSEPMRIKLLDKASEIRAKAMDDMRRNRNLMACGRLVLPATKEDLYGEGSLDAFTRNLLSCARAFCDVNVDKWLENIDDTSRARDRRDLLADFLPIPGHRGRLHGMA